MVMKKLPAYIMVIALLVMNIATVAHADCAEGILCSGIQAVVSIDDASDHDGEKQNASCDCCATCGGHHHHYAAFAVGKVDSIMASSQSLHSSNGDTYLSQLNYPPSKPPRV